MHDIACERTQGDAEKVLACDCASTEHGPRPFDSCFSFDLLFPPLSFVDRLQLLEERIDYECNNNIVEDYYP
jgi:hypothetical protein